MTTIQRDTISYTVIALASGILLLWIIPAFSPEYPGYGAPATLVPDIAAGFMLGLSLLGLLKIAWTRAGYERTKVDGVHWRHLVKFFVPCGIMMPAMPYLGFIPAGVLFLLVIQLSCGQRHPVPLVLIAVLPVVLVYLLMRYVLSVPMP